MGYDISLEKDGKTVKLHKPLNLIGSVYAVDGSDEASYAITFNYSEFYTKAFDDPDGIGCLDGLCYSDGIAKIATAISRLSFSFVEYTASPRRFLISFTTGLIMLSASSVVAAEAVMRRCTSPVFA